MRRASGARSGSDPFPALEPALRGLGRRGRRAVVAGVLRDGETAYGAWFPRGAPVDATSLFEIGSITKAFTGVLLADMVLAGEVRLEDPLSRHLASPRPAWRGREPTLLDLATHRTGLPNTPGPLGRREVAYVLGLRRAHPWDGLDAAAWERLVAAESPRRARARYSSLAVALLGEALAARAGLPYDELLTERVLRPLGLERTAVRPAEPVVPGHSRRGRPRPPLQDLMPAAGSLRSCAADMLRFLAACLDPPAERPGPALRLARQPHARLRRGMQVGLCWLLATPRNGPTIAWHNGGTWGFHSFAGFVPEAGRAAVVLSNSVRPVEGAGFRLLQERGQSPFLHASGGGAERA